VGSDPTNTAQDLNQLLGQILRIDVDHPVEAANRRLGGHLKSGHRWTGQNRP